MNEESPGTLNRKGVLSCCQLALLPRPAGAKVLGTSSGMTRLPAKWTDRHEFSQYDKRALPASAAMDRSSRRRAFCFTSAPRQRGARTSQYAGYPGARDTYSYFRLPSK